MEKVYIVEAKRTSIGGFLGGLSSLKAGDLGAQLLQKILKNQRNIIPHIDEVLIGNVLPAGQGQGIARQVSIGGGVPVEIPATTLNMVCGSGMKTVMIGYANIKAGFQHLVIAGGAESMSNAPFLLPANIRKGNKLGSMKTLDHIVDDALTDVFNNYHMGITAENIAEAQGISREEQDVFSLESQRRAINAIDSKRFVDEIIPITISTRKGDVVVDTDEHVNRNTSLEKLAKLRTVFKKDGTVTAGSSSGINDGASIILLASEEAVKQYDLKPLAEIIAIGQGGVDPSVMGLGPVPAIKQVLENADMTLDQMELIELNEAFAAQSIGVINLLAKDYGVSKETLLSITNVNGGAIALGHPVGTSGNRIIVTLLHEMIKRNQSYGLASLCIGGGMGTAVIIKNLK